VERSVPVAIAKALAQRLSRPRKTHLTHWRVLGVGHCDVGALLARRVKGHERIAKGVGLNRDLGLYNWLALTGASGV